MHRRRNWCKSARIIPNQEESHSELATEVGTELGKITRHKESFLKSEKRGNSNESERGWGYIFCTVTFRNTRNIIYKISGILFPEYDGKVKISGIFWIYLESCCLSKN